jgi:DNA-binding protein H-NS
MENNSMATNVANQLASIQKQKLALQKKEEALLKKSHDKVITKIVQLAKEAGLTASDIAKAMNAGKPVKAKAAKASKKTGPRGKVAPKYRNPSNHAETWTGRGVSPKWIAELKAAGTLDSALIAQSVVHAEAPTTH